MKPWFRFTSRIVETHFASVMTLNNWEMIAETRSYIFRWRSRCRRQRVCQSCFQIIMLVMLITTIPGARFSKVPKLFGWHNSLCILKAKAFQDTKLYSYFNFPSHYIMWKDQLYRTSGSEFYGWLFGPEKFSGLLRNGSQVCIETKPLREKVWAHTGKLTVGYAACVAWDKIPSNLKQLNLYQFSKQLKLNLIYCQRNIVKHNLSICSFSLIVFYL